MAETQRVLDFWARIYEEQMSLLITFIFQRLPLRRKRTLVGTSVIPHTTDEDTLFKNGFTHVTSLRYVIINRDDEEGAGQSQLGRGHRVTDVEVNIKQLSFAF